MRFAYESLEDLRRVTDITDEEAANSDFGSNTTDEFFDVLFRLTSFRTDPDLSEILVTQSLETMAWLRTKGAKFILNHGRQSGMMIPLLCDAVVAADSARFSLPEINKGLPALPGVAIVKDRFGSALAADLVLSGRWMPAQEAHTRGVVREVVTAANLQAAAQQIAVTLGAFDTAAYAADKALLNRTLKANLAASIANSAEFHGHKS